jgi:hypothetical protein
LAPLDCGEFTGRVAGALRVSESEASALITELAGARLLQEGDDERAAVKVTDAGHQLAH